MAENGFSAIGRARDIGLVLINIAGSSGNELPAAPRYTQSVWLRSPILADSSVENITELRHSVQEDCYVRNPLALVALGIARRSIEEGMY